tara:strand:- start:2540 stop:2980 length:441 start_codon:yes stop_codon:yes gene_type:complete
MTEIPNLPNQIPVQGSIPESYDRNLLGVIIVDHGSKRSEGNIYVNEMARLLQRHTDMEIVEPAHMELAAPDIDAAYQSCVTRGAKYIVVHPYFLAPGRHWHQDIPELVRLAAQKHPETSCLVTPPLGIHRSMVDIIATRIMDALPS